MDGVMQFGQLLIAAGAALGIREAWPYLYKYLRNRQTLPAASARQAANERREYADGWRGVADRLERDLDVEKKERQEDRKEIGKLRDEISKCERRDVKRVGIIARLYDRIRELTDTLEASGITVRHWTLEETDVHAALSPDSNGGTDDSSD